MGLAQLQGCRESNKPQELLPVSAYHAPGASSLERSREQFPFFATPYCEERLPHGNIRLIKSFAWPPTASTPLQAPSEKRPNSLFVLFQKILWRSLNFRTHWPSWLLEMTCQSSPLTTQPRRPAWSGALGQARGMRWVCLQMDGFPLVYLFHNPKMAPENEMISKKEMVSESGLKSPTPRLKC